MLLILTIMAITTVSPISVYGATAPTGGKMTVTREYTYKEGEAPNIPETINQFGQVFTLVSVSEPVESVTLPDTRTYTYSVSRTYTPDQLSQVPPNVQLTPVYGEGRRQVDRNEKISGLSNNDVDKLPQRKTYSDTNGRGPGAGADGELVLAEVKYETAGVDEYGIPKKYTAHLVYRGEETYSQLLYYTAVVTYTGVAGADGAAGPAESTGVAGTAGATGATGTAGASGSAGADGATRAAGATGSSGDTGSVGADGATGAIGTSGATGSAGAYETVGTYGDIGTAGDTEPVDGAAKTYTVVATYEVDAPPESEIGFTEVLPEIDRSDGGAAAASTNQGGPGGPDGSGTDGDAGARAPFSVSSLSPIGIATLATLVAAAIALLFLGIYNRRRARENN